MALDTAAKRRSAAGIYFPWGPGVTPDATPDAFWRQSAGYGYGGIAAGAEVGMAAHVGALSQIINEHIVEQRGVAVFPAGQIYKQTLDAARAARPDVSANIAIRDYLETEH